MNEKTLTRFSIIGTIASILALYIVTNHIFSSSIDIGEIDKTFVGKSVNIPGEITSISNSEGNFFIKLKDESGEIKVVLWEDIIKSINTNDIDVNKLNKGDKINVIGDVQIYKGEIEIIPIRGNIKLA